MAIDVLDSRTRKYVLSRLGQDVGDIDLDNFRTDRSAQQGAVYQSGLLFVFLKRSLDAALIYLGVIRHQ